ncbi:Ca2+-binding protein [Commensalibacter communis]|uniref:Hint domain-containing protein n=1 Tax=Commensalibacter communis TaxID=2972786 RepID=UPI0022FF5073|nr:Hint domain-containing protein [Commensalibacter communis]CAI3944197.1 Ca2+-binding protein [Commensalibacter communis]
MSKITSQNTSDNIIYNIQNLVIPRAAMITNTIRVNAGQTITNSTINSGEEIIVSSGGSSTYLTLNGGVQYISSGGVDRNATVYVGSQFVYSGGSAINTSVYSGGVQYISGGTIYNGKIISGGVQYVYDNGIVSGSWVASNGVAVSASEVLKGGVQYVYGGNVFSTMVRGIQYIYSGVVRDTTIEGLSASQYVLSGGEVRNIIVNGGATQVISGGIMNSGDVRNFSNSDVLSVVSTGGYTDTSIISFMQETRQYVSGGGIVNNVTVSARGLSYISKISKYNPWGQYSYITYYEDYGAVQYVLNGGIVNGGKITGTVNGAGSIINDGRAIQYVSSGGVVNDIDVYLGGKQYISDGGIVNRTRVDYGQQHILSGGKAYSTIIGYYNKGIQYVSSSGLASDTTISQTGSMVVFSGGIIDGNTVVSGGYLSIANGGVLEGNVMLNPGGRVTIGLSNGGSVDLIGNNNSGLIISGYTAGINTSVSTVISNFSGLGSDFSDKVTVDGLQAANVSSVTYPDDDHITLKLLDGTSLTLNMIGIKQTGYTLGSDVNGNLTMIVCFLTDTMIKMAKGVCAVEDIQVGDTVLSYDPKSKAKVKKKVIWVGKQTARVNARLPDDQAGYPVRILKNAFKKNVPNKDLLITAEHCLFIDGYFVPARMLVNGRSIFYDYSMMSYEYYHIETEDHSVIWADGMLTESYLNTGNRHAFNRDQKVVVFDPQVKSWDKDAAAPLMVGRSFVEPVFNNLVKRADKQKILIQNSNNVVLSNDHGLYLLTEDGEQIRQNRAENNVLIFKLPANTKNVYLVSRKSRPCDVIGPFVDDRRFLGVLVGHVTVSNEFGADLVTRYLQQDELQGWSVVEQSPCRWTTGCAFLPLDVYHADSEFEITIQIISAGPYIVEENLVEEEKIAV